LLEMLKNENLIENIEDDSWDSEEHLFRFSLGLPESNITNVSSVL